MVVVVGLSTILVVVCDVGFQVYELAPLAVNVAELPEQIAALVTETLGTDTTVTTAVLLPVQAPLVPEIV